jgi:hypothetical protein
MTGCPMQQLHWPLSLVVMPGAESFWYLTAETPA